MKYLFKCLKNRIKTNSDKYSNRKVEKYFDFDDPYTCLRFYKISVFVFVLYLYFLPFFLDFGEFLADIKCGVIIYLFLYVFGLFIKSCNSAYMFLFMVSVPLYLATTVMLVCFLYQTMYTSLNIYSIIALILFIPQAYFLIQSAYRFDTI